MIKQSINHFLGAVNVRSHTKATVVNKLSRQHRNSNHDETSTRTTTNAVNENSLKENASSNATNLSSIPINGHPTHPTNAGRTKRSQNEWIFSTAVTLIRQPTENFVSGLTVPFNMESVWLATAFGLSRGFINPEEMMNQSEQTARACSSLFIISWHGRLIEYVLEPIPDTSKHGVRVTSETPLALKATPKAEWLLQRYYIVAFFFGKYR